MAVKYICDKCGKEVSKKELTQVIIQNEDLHLKENMNEIKFDICGECFLKIEKMNKNDEKFPVLNTDEVDIEKQILKIREESEELIAICRMYEAGKSVSNQVIEEAFDTIQTVVNIIDRFGLMMLFNEKNLDAHKKKLKNRDWDIKYYI